jgi:hypothetical protein
LLVSLVAAPMCRRGSAQSSYERYDSPHPRGGRDDRTRVVRCLLKLPIWFGRRCRTNSDANRIFTVLRDVSATTNPTHTNCHRHRAGPIFLSISSLRVFQMSVGPAQCAGPTGMGKIRCKERSRPINWSSPMSVELGVGDFCFGASESAS